MRHLFVGYGAEQVGEPAGDTEMEGMEWLLIGGGLTSPHRKRGEPATP